MRQRRRPIIMRNRRKSKMQTKLYGEWVSELVCRPSKVSSFVIGRFLANSATQRLETFCSQCLCILNLMWVSEKAWEGAEEEEEEKVVEKI